MWQPLAAYAADEGCTLEPSGHAQGNEWLGCLRVSAELASLPATGEQATLNFEVTAQVESPRLTVEAQLPSNLDWASVPEGFEPRDGHLAIGEISLGANETRRFAGTVRATAPGGAQITVRATAPPQLDPDDGSVQSRKAAGDHQFLTVAEAGGRSTPGIEGEAEGDAEPSSDTTEPTLATAGLRYHPVPRAAEAAAATAAVIAAPGDTSCVTGSFGYLEGAVSRLSMNIEVQVWDQDFQDGNDLLASGYTDGQGEYNFCFPTDDTDGGLPASGQDVFVKFLSQNYRWRVQEYGNGKVFSWNGPTKYNLAAFATHDFGYLKPSDPKYHLGLQAFDAVNDFYSFVPGTCWDDNDTGPNCQQVVINWRWDSDKGDHYDYGLKQVFLLKDSPKSRIVVVHEAAHAVMDDVYEGTPIPGAGGPHFIDTASNAGMAWVEGFAEWVPLTVYSSPSFDWEDGTTENLENKTWGSAGWGNGDITEGRVAGALVDISDPTNETPWDRSNEGNVSGNIWTTFLGPAVGPPRVQKSFKDFWTHRTADGFNVAATGALASIYQSTIDYNFRDPIGNNSPVTRPHPVVPHNFSFETTSFFWSAVAIRPNAGADHDLKLYEEENLATSLGSSQAFGSTVDFLAIDSNKKTLTDYFPQVYQASGNATVRVELAQGSLSLAANSSQTVSMGLGTKVIAVRDTFLSAGTTVTIKVTPTTATQDSELFLMRSTTGQPATFVRSRAQAYKSSTAAGPGAAEMFTFVVPSTDWYGVVITFKAGMGNLTLQRIG